MPVEATTMEQIAEKAEVGTSTVYRYFHSKDEILLVPYATLTSLSAALRQPPSTSSCRSP